MEGPKSIAAIFLQSAGYVYHCSTLVATSSDLKIKLIFLFQIFCLVIFQEKKVQLINLLIFFRGSVYTRLLQPKELFISYLYYLKCYAKCSYIVFDCN